MKTSNPVKGGGISFPGNGDSGEVVLASDKIHLRAVDRFLTCVGFQAFIH